MGKSKDLATLKDSGLSIDGTLTTTSTGTNLTSNSYNVVKIQTDKDDNGSNDDAILQFTTGSSNTVKGELRYDESESMFEIGHGDNQGHIRIDTSGRVTTPNQPSFYAYTSTDYTATGNLTGGGNWAEKWDVGNNFSAGTFTAPVAGKYYFEVMWDANSIQSTIDIQINNTSQVRYEPTGRTDSTWETHFYSAILNLAANDSVRLYGNMHSQSSANPYHMGGSGQWGHFAGFLIG